MRGREGRDRGKEREGGEKRKSYSTSSNRKASLIHIFFKFIFRIKLIRLCRGPSGLGFTIVGGKGSTHGDLPIFIKRVFNEGAAGRDGRLKMGDQLLAVNGVSFENVTHQFAAETLKYLQGDVELAVLSTE